MSELLVVAGIAASGLLCAALMSRWLINQSGELVSARVVQAVLRASDRFMSGVGKRTAIALVAMLGVAALLSGASVGHSNPVLTVALCAGLLLGGLGALGAAYLASQLGIRIATRAATAASLSLAHTTNVLLRGSCGVMMAGTALALLVSTLLVATIFLLTGDATPAGDLVGTPTQAVLGLAVGAGATAMITQLAGSTFSGAAAKSEGRAPASVVPDAQSALLLNHLVGRQVGAGASIGADAFFLTALGIATAMALMSPVARANEKLDCGPLTLMILPALTVGIGLVAAAFAVLSARSDETEDGSPAIGRGQLASLILIVIGLGAASHWLFAAPVWQVAFAASTLGTISGALLARGPRWELVRAWLTRHDPRPAPAMPLPREVMPSSAALVSGLGWTSLLLGGCLTLGWQLGHRSELAHGDAFGLALTLSGLLASVTYMATVHFLEPLTQTAHSLLGLTPSERGETRSRAEQTKNLGFGPATTGRSYMTALGQATALLVCLSLIALLPPASVPNVVGPPHLWGVLLGAAGVSAYVGIARSRLSHTAARLLALSSDPEASPRYREPLELATRHSLAYLPLPLLTVVIAAGLTVLAAHTLGTPQQAVTLHTVLASFVLAQVALTLPAGSLSQGERQAVYLGEAGTGVSSVALAAEALGPCPPACARAFTLISAALSLLIATHSTYTF